jgi:hypothetical protein
MGSAVSKGWQIVESSDNRLVVKRPLDAAAAQAATGEPVSAASVEVKSDFFKRQDGVNVVVDASLVANKGSKAERKIDFTESYRDDLNRSLGSLRQAWEENRWRVASSTPPLPTKVEAPEEEAAASTTAAIGGEQVTDSQPGTASDFGAETASVTPPAPVAAPVATTAAAAAAPVEDRSAGTAPSPVAPSTASTAAPNNMLVLNTQTEQGVWAYYAEHYAKIRGCELSNEGAVLEDKGRNMKYIASIATTTRRFW